MKLQKKQKLLIVATVFIIITWGARLLYSSNRSRDLNVILITIDALRADHLGCNGYKRNTSPNINKLANEGILFTQVIGQGMNTFASLPSIITSTYPYTHKVLSCGDAIDSSCEIITEILKNQGYSTGLISGYNLLAKIGGLNRGFDTVKYLPSFWGYIEYFFNKWENMLRKFLSIKPDPSEYCFIYDARKITHLAIKWLSNKKNKPFFLWIHYFEVHGFYKNLPSPYKKMFLYDDFYKGNKHVPISDSLSNVYGGHGHIPYYISEMCITDLDYYIAQYDAAIRYVDTQIGLLMEKLKRLNFYNKTIVVLTADHGESLGEHNFYLDHDSLYDEIIKIPLIIKCNGILPKGIIINSQLESIDIVPTILDILKIKSTKLKGVSLLPLISGRQEQPLEHAFSMSSEATSIRTKDWKLIHNLTTDKNELYNLNDDPGELTNLISMEKEKFKFLKRRLDYYLNNLALSKSIKPKQPLDEYTKEKLRSFGYAQ